MASETGTASGQDLETLSKDGKAPESRLSKPSSAYSIFKKLYERDQERSRKRSVIQGQIDGNPPYKKSKLKQLGQGHRSNVNFRDAESIRDARKTSYYELLIEVETLVNAVPKPGKFKDNEPNNYKDVIEEEFTAMLVKWPGFWYNMQLHQGELITWGIGNCYWENELDWRFKAARAGSFLVPDETESSPDDLEIIGIRKKFKVHNLFRKIVDEETTEKSRAAGWNIPLLKHLIIRANENQSTPHDKWSLGEWESLQQKIKDNDLEYTYAIGGKVQCVHLLVEEFDGQISHFIISEDEEFNTQNTEDPPYYGEFLFKHVNRYKSWENVVWLCFANIGEGTYHGVRGLGSKIFAHCVLGDRLKNATVDGAIASATILLQPNNEGQTEKARMVRVAPFSILPTGFSLIPHGSFQPDLKGLIGVDALLADNLKRNAGLQRPSVTQTDKTPQGKTNAQMASQATHEAKLERGDINMYYVQWDRLWEEVKRRIFNPDLLDIDPGYKSAHEFIEACKARGVPKTVLKEEFWTFKARRAIGFGSPVMKSILSADVLSVSPYMDEKGKFFAVRDYLIARVGVDAANRYMPPLNRNGIPSEEHSHASLENNDLKEGDSVIVGADQNHVIHLATHLQPLVQLADEYNNGQIQDVRGLFIHMSASLRHSAKHLDFIQNDPARTNEYQSFRGQFEQLVRVHSTLEAQVTRLAQQEQRKAEEQAQLIQQAQEAVQGDDLKIKLAEMQQDFQIRIMKIQGNQQIAEAKALHGMEIKSAVANHQIAIDTAQAVSST